MRVSPVSFSMVLVAWLSLGAFVQDPQQDPQPKAPDRKTQDPKTGLGPGPGWRGPVRPSGRNEVFATGDGCAMCHSNAKNALAMRTATSEEVSPHKLWQASVMANSFLDPYWRAQVEKEMAADPENAEDVQALCMRCHAPMVHHSRRIAGQGPIAVADAAADPLARDGVSCTVCHQIQAEGLGTEETFAGKPKIQRGRRIFGPYAEPVATPMQNMASYQPVHGAHVQSSALCASCHTLHTEHAGVKFPEQTPYLEWRNSIFQDESGKTEQSRTCQECHMADLGSMRIARNPGGRDFLIPVRDHFRAHSFVGGNAFLLDLLAANKEALGVTADVEALQRNAMASRRLLANETVAMTIGEITRGEGAVQFAVRVENLTGHKFPTGYPSRRAWLHVQVRDGNQVVFDSGGWTADGHLANVADELRQPHYTRVTDPSQVVIWEMVANDEKGEPTMHLTHMATRGKDTRLLPKGWRRDGPHAEDTAPKGIGNDLDFTAGGDTVNFAIPLAKETGPVTVVAWVRYQPIPAHWVDSLRSVDMPACKTFVAMYDAASKTPDVAGVVARSED